MDAAITVDIVDSYWSASISNVNLVVWLSSFEAQSLTQNFGTCEIEVASTKGSPSEIYVDL